jgi:hypothetical protein
MKDQKKEERMLPIFNLNGWKNIKNMLMNLSKIKKHIMHLIHLKD